MPNLVASFQNAVVDVLVSRAITAAKEYGYKKLAIAGRWLPAALFVQP